MSKSAEFRQSAARTTSAASHDGLTPPARPLTELDLRRLVAEHLGMKAEFGNPQVPGIADHVLPSTWTPVR